MQLPAALSRHVCHCPAGGQIESDLNPMTGVATYWADGEGVTGTYRL